MRITALDMYPRLCPFCQPGVRVKTTPSPLKVKVMLGAGRWQCSWCEQWVGIEATTRSAIGLTIWEFA